MDYFYIGIDDTDSPDGMCTTYLASSILNEFERNAIEIEDFPRLIRLNPFAPFKTRGNGGVSFKLSLDQDIALAKEIVLDYVSRLSMFDCENTNPGVVFYDGEIIIYPNRKMNNKNLETLLYSYKNGTYVKGRTYFLVDIRNNYPFVIIIPPLFP